MSYIDVVNFLSHINDTTHIGVDRKVLIKYYFVANPNEQA